MNGQLEWMVMLLVAVGITLYALYTFYNLSNFLGDRRRS